MTKEELKVHCEKQIKECEMWAKHKGEEPSGKVYEEHKLILELLEQEPCEDAVSRQEVLDLIADYDLSMGQVVRGIHALPSVTPQPRKWHWVRVTDKEGHLVWKCDKCGWQQRYNTNFCPDCGTDMREVEE